MGGISACGAYRYRVEIKNRLVFIKIKTLKTVDDAKCRALMLGDLASRSASNVANATKSRAVALKNKTSEMGGATRTKVGEWGSCAITTRTGVTATSAAVGGLAGSVAGGSTGTVVGALVGIVP